MPEPSRERSDAARDWTHGPAKWLAAVVIGAASVGGIVWSVVSKPAGRSGVVHPPAEQAGRTQQIKDEKEPPRTASPIADAAGPKRDGGEPDEQLSRETAAENSAGSSVININTATAAELELLPGIGPALAARIIEHREKYGAFRSVDELDRVKGIGPKILERVRSLVRVE